MNLLQAQEKAASLYGNVQLQYRSGDGLGWCVIHVWDTTANTYVLRGFGHTWEDAFIDAARYETAEIAYA